MSAIQSCELPPDAFLRRYVTSGAFADCYVTEVAGSASQAEFVEAFYTTPLFKLERFVLSTAVSRPSTDAQARQLARGESSTFAAWAVEDRAADQLLLSDLTGRTRSWLKIAATSDTRTRLYFGSAVIPVTDRATGRPSLGPTFSALLGFHKAYSRALLYSARLRLSRSISGRDRIRRGDGQR
jgi:hypothetical protein